MREFFTMKQKENLEKEIKPDILTELDELEAKIKELEETLKEISRNK